MRLIFPSSAGEAVYAVCVNWSGLKTEGQRADRVWKEGEERGERSQELQIAVKWTKSYLKGNSTILNIVCFQIL